MEPQLHQVAAMRTGKQWAVASVVMLAMIAVGVALIWSFVLSSDFTEWHANFAFCMVMSCGVWFIAAPVAYVLCVQVVTERAKKSTGAN